MNWEDFSKPKLIEPGVKYFLNETLKQSHLFKMKHHNLFFNLGLFFFFICINIAAFSFVRIACKLEELYFHLFIFFIFLLWILVACLSL